jgi:hypothetical protein
MSETEQFFHPAEYVGKTLHIRSTIALYGIEHSIADMMNQADMSLPAIGPHAPPHHEVAGQRRIAALRGIWQVVIAKLLE